MKATIIFLISIVFQTTIQLQIKEEVFYCNKTNIILNWKLPCNSSSSHSNCVHLSNFRTMLNRDQDKYNFIYLSTQKDVVYRDRCTSDTRIVKCDIFVLSNDYFLKNDRLQLVFGDYFSSPLFVIDLFHINLIDSEKVT